MLERFLVHLSMLETLETLSRMSFLLLSATLHGVQTTGPAREKALRHWFRV